MGWIDQIRGLRPLEDRLLEAITERPDSALGLAGRLNLGWLDRLRIYDALWTLEERGDVIARPSPGGPERGYRDRVSYDVGGEP